MIKSPLKPLPQIVIAVALFFICKLVTLPLYAIAQTIPIPALRFFIFLIIKSSIVFIPIAFLQWIYPLEKAGIDKEYSTRSLPLLVVLLFAASNLTMRFTEMFQAKFGWTIPNPGTEMPSNPIEILFVLCWVIIIPAVGEEWLFRHQILRRMEFVGRFQSIIAAAIIFGMVHSSPAQMLVATLGGVFLGVVATGWDLKSAMVLHAGYNGFILLFNWFFSQL